MGTADNCVTIDSNDVIVDNTWLWRADHGAGADWNTNKSKNGIIVNGTGVTIYGLFVEHFQEYQTLWNGDGGSVYFYQSELPYDPPTQDDWREGPGINGYASYKVADSVTSHQAFGLGVYSVFTNDVQADNAIETPTGDGVTMRDMVTVSLRIRVDQSHHQRHGRNGRTGRNHGRDDGGVATPPPVRSRGARGARPRC